ncbi:putative short-chain dehydrogenase [Mollisia scopiformis]|uniref:Putative short-chain dehydrogenase n=1 Tax=Mollisia scopiformis TaxID=149040 RepID=A0A132B358_MOLSC|nr:putative short-chain dehydrogenase [Mollisia scopiformis]KUJ06683.1 putative short-chain dehydrogenase [Mollisia scopiformis]
MATYKPYSRINAFFPPAPTYTDSNLPSLQGKVHIVTGAASGVGYEVAKFIYLAGGTVYVAARSTARCEGAIEKIKAETASEKGKGKLDSLVVDLSDLRTIKGGVESFLKKEQRLDVLIHNAGIMSPPAGSKDKLGHDLEFGTNVLGPYLMTLLLEPILIKTATLPDTPKLSVRLVWVVSLVQGWAPVEAMRYEKDGTPVVLKGTMENYMQSKVGDVWLATDVANRLGKHGVMSVSLHPGVVRTELQRHWPLPVRMLIGAIMKPCVYAAYSELYAAFSSDVKPEQNGGHLMAWGRKADMPPYISAGFKSKSEGGTGGVQKFFEYCNREIKDYL